ncbi:MAG: DnaJ domain-containing protein, partial [Candidatus Aenigmarchaeota archaeon]|nr:DnaJ domain-containing protein [Candidatus Aenigmarchaeota archaeon]
MTSSILKAIPYKDIREKYHAIWEEKIKNKIVHYGRDYYRTLGVGRKNTSDEIKKAYRKLGFIYHPDHHEGKNIYKEVQDELNKKYGNEARDI